MILYDNVQLCLMYCLTLYIYIYIHTHTLYIHNIIHNIIYICQLLPTKFPTAGLSTIPLVPGGHTEHILSRLSGSGRLIAFDVEPLGTG